jgi:hypothetical protein
LSWGRYLELVENLKRKGEVRVNACAELTDESRAEEQLVRRDLGGSRKFLEGGDECPALAHGSYYYSATGQLGSVLVLAPFVPVSFWMAFAWSSSRLLRGEQMP